MKNYLREYCEVKNKIKDNRRIFVAVKKYLKNGIYRSSIAGNAIIRDESLESKKMLITFDGLTTETSPLSFVYKFMSQKETLENLDSARELEGDYVIISSSRKEYKIFSDEKLITVYTDKSVLERILQGREVFEKYFNVPKIFSIDMEEGVICEEVIKKEYLDPVKGIEIFEDYEKFLRNNKVQEENWNIKMQKFLERFPITVEFDVIKTLPKVYSHGDLWTENIMYDGVKYYITDYEKVGKRYFLFDYFMYIFSEFFLKGNEILMRLYFAGDHDEMLSKMFHAVSTPFEKKWRREYFAAFIIAIYEERWEHANSKMLNYKIRKVISQFLEV